MARADEDRIACRTPAEGREGVTRIPRWKYEALQRAILAEIDAAGADGVAFKTLAAAVGQRLSDEEKARLGSLGWHTTVVKLNMEVDGEIVRLSGAKPQRIARP